VFYCFPGEKNIRPKNEDEYTCTQFEEVLKTNITDLYIVPEIRRAAKNI
jgi:hypothetical protein